MNKYYRASRYFILLSLLLFFSCKNEKKPDVVEASPEPPAAAVDYASMVLGNWELERAFRDGERVDALANTMFHFKEDGSVTSNFNMQGQEQNNKYIVEKDIITQTGQSNFTYLIKSATDTSMVLITRYRGYGFQLNLSKWEPDVQVQ